MKTLAIGFQPMTRAHSAHAWGAHFRQAITWPIDFTLFLYFFIPWRRQLAPSSMTDRCRLFSEPHHL